MMTGVVHGGASVWRGWFESYTIRCGRSLDKERSNAMKTPENPNLSIQPRTYRGVGAETIRFTVPMR